MLAESTTARAGRVSTALLACLVATIAPVAARADGEFAQVDVSNSTIGATASIQRGTLTFGGVITLPDGDPSATLSLTQALPLPAESGFPTLRVGPTLGLTGEDLSNFEVGVRLMGERYVGTDWGNVYGLVDLGSIDRSWFVLGQVGLRAPGLTLELSRGGSDEYSEATIAVSKRLPNSPVSLRTGYQFEAGEVFVGMSFNTF